jgi:hypothetical protein
MRVCAFGPLSCLPTYTGGKEGGKGTQTPQVDERPCSSLFIFPGSYPPIRSLDMHFRLKNINTCCPPFFFFFQPAACRRARGPPRGRRRAAGERARRAPRARVWREGRGCRLGRDRAGGDRAAARCRGAGREGGGRGHGARRARGGGARPDDAVRVGRQEVEWALVVFFFLFFVFFLFFFCSFPGSSPRFWLVFYFLYRQRALKCMYYFLVFLLFGCLFVFKVLVMLIIF